MTALPVPANDAPAQADASVTVAVEVLTAPELAALLRLHEKSVYELLAEGQIPGARKIRGTWRIHRPTVVAWLSGQTSASPKKAGRR